MYQLHPGRQDQAIALITSLSDQLTDKSLQVGGT